MIPSILLILALSVVPTQGASESVVLGAHTISLETRYAVPSVNQVFKDNILLTLKYMEGEVKSGDKINWEEVERDTRYEFTLNPGEKFAFHDVVLPAYKDNLVKTTGAHYNYHDGFKSDGYLMGDGVCHFASLVYWVARDAGLETYVPKNHDFAAIPEVPKEYGVSIYVLPQANQGAMNNLYIVNNKEKPVTFIFEYKEGNLSVTAAMEK